ncbi:hypothetical protein H0H81_005336, partial [Sphagnurus paluster]
LHVHTSETLGRLEGALRVFHENKDIIVRAGLREHFNIPKLHQMLHYVDAIKSHGSADGYNTKSPEQLHIDFAKDAYQALNKRDYVKQMATWLRPQEAVTHYSAYLDWLSDDTPDNPDSNPNSDNDDYDHYPPPCALVPLQNDTQHRISVKPGFPKIDLTTITTSFKATFFLFFQPSFDNSTLYHKNHSFQMQPIALTSSKFYQFALPISLPLVVSTSLIGCDVHLWFLLSLARWRLALISTLYWCEEMLRMKMR